MSTPTTAAMVWLRAHLAAAGGSDRTAQVIASGRAAGHPESSLRRAGRVLGVQIAGSGPDATWTSRDGAGDGVGDGVPLEAVGPDQAADEQPAQPPRAKRKVRVPISPPDVYGWHSEWAKVDVDVASHWDADNWTQL